MTIPTIQELFISIQSDLRNKTNISSIIGKTVLNAFAIVQAAKLKIFYLRSNLTYKNIFVDQADNDMILRFGRIILKRDPYPATSGVYQLQVSGEIGAVIAAGTTFKSRDTSLNPGKLFVLDTLFTFIAPSGLIEVRALEIGQDAKLEVTNQLKITQPVADVDSIAEVMSVISEPIESETIEEYRQKVITAYQIEPQGGARVDFVLWALDAQGCRRVYPYVKNGFPSEVNIYVESNPSDSNPIDTGIPTGTIITNVETVTELDPDTSKPMEDRGRRPMWAVCNFLPILPLNVDVDITNLSDTSLLPDIKNAIKSFLFNIRPYLDGADNANKSQQGKLYPSDITIIIRDTIGNETFDNVVVKVNGTIITSVFNFTEDKIPYINSVVNV